MSDVIKITKLHFLALFDWQIASCAGVLLLNLLISVAVTRLTDTGNPAGAGDFIALLWMPIMGLIFFSPSFRYALSRGMTRRRFFLAGALSLAALAAALAILVTVFYLINLEVANIWMLYQIIYRNGSLPGLIIWELAALLFSGMLGWFVRMVYYVSNRPTRLIVSITPFFLAALAVLFNALAGGGIGRATWDFGKAVMGQSSGGSAPYIGAASLLAAAAILGGAVFLLLRRAQLTD
jgi:hypothetical protein